MEELRGDDGLCWDIIDGEAECEDDTEGYDLDECSGSISSSPFCGVALRTDDYAMCCIGETFECHLSHLSFTLIAFITAILCYSLW